MTPLVENSISLSMIASGSVPPNKYRATAFLDLLSISDSSITASMASMLSGGGAAVGLVAGVVPAMVLFFDFCGASVGFVGGVGGGFSISSRL